MVRIRNMDVIMAVANAEKHFEKGELEKAVERVNFSTQLYDIFQYHMGHTGIWMRPRYQAIRERIVNTSKYRMDDRGYLAVALNA